MFQETPEQGKNLLYEGCRGLKEKRYKSSCLWSMPPEHTREQARVHTLHIPSPRCSLQGELLLKEIKKEIHMHTHKEIIPAGLGGFAFQPGRGAQSQQIRERPSWAGSPSCLAWPCRIPISSEIKGHAQAMGCGHRTAFKGPWAWTGRARPIGCCWHK